MSTKGSQRWIETLVQLAPPPAQAIGTGGSEDWMTYQEQWNIRFPSDYIDFVKLYGRGGFFDEVSIATPFEPRDIMSEQAVIAPSYLSSKAASSGELTLDFYPTLPGLIYIGGTSNGDEILWHATGQPDSWTIVLYAHAYIDPEHYDFGLVEFLARWLDGTLGSRLMWPASDLVKIRPKPVFQSITT